MVVQRHPSVDIKPAGRLLVALCLSLYPNCCVPSKLVIFRVKAPKLFLDLKVESARGWLIRIGLHKKPHIIYQ